MTIAVMTTYSKACDCTILKHWSLKQLIGSTGMIFGLVWTRSLWILTHSFCSSVKLSDPCLFLISSLNLSTITEINRFMMKKVVKKMNTMKMIETHSLACSCGTRSMSTPSMAAYIIPGHISRVEISKKVSIELKILS